MKTSKLSIAATGGSIIERITGKKVSAEVVLVTEEEIKTVHKKDGWAFNWKIEYKQDSHQVFKLIISGNNAIQGLLSLEPIKDQRFVEMHLIESAPRNKGKLRQFHGIASNLVAFACKMSLEMGFDGYVAFTAKTKLVDHYIASLGASVLFKNRMVIFPDPSKKLVNLYY